MTDSRPRVTVLAGFSPAATDAVARSLLVTDPTLILVAHDDIPALVRLSRRHPGSDLILALAPAVEPAAVAAAYATSSVDGVAVTDAVCLDSFVTVVEAAALHDDLTSTDDLRDRDLHAAGDDDRTVAEVVSRQIEFADTIVAWSTPDFDVLERDRLTALLHRLAPSAAHVRIGDSPLVDCTDLAARLLRTGRHDPSDTRRVARPARSLRRVPSGRQRAEPGGSLPGSRAVTRPISTEERAVPVVVLCGFWAHAVAEVADRLLADHPLAASGDVLLTVAPPGCEPDQIRTAGRTDSAPHIVTVVPADLLLDGLTDDRALRTVDLHRAEDDERSIGELVARQLEQADTVVLTGRPEGDDDWEAEQLRTLLRRIAPWSRHSNVDDLCLSTPGRTEPVAAVTRGLRGRTLGVHHPSAEHGVVSCLFRARRPFHPGRLHDALDEITEGVLRSRGTFWLASRPDVVLTWESADGLSIGAHSGWLAVSPDEPLDDVEEERWLAAAVDWDPYYDDRGQHLAFVGIDIDPVSVHRALARCLITDAELADGWDSWAALPDPFERCFRLVPTEEKPR